MLSARTRAQGAEREIRRVASIPFNSGIATSMTTTFGVNCSASSTASRPLPASPTTSMSGCESSISRNPWRTIAWSSANKIRVFFCMGLTFNRNAHFDQDPLLARATKLQYPSGAPRSRAHPDHSHPFLSAPVPVVQPAAIVRDGKTDIVPLRAETDRHMGGAGMPGNVGQSFLAYAEEVSFRLIGQPAPETGTVIHGDP